MHRAEILAGRHFRCAQSQTSRLHVLLKDALVGHAALLTQRLIASLQPPTRTCQGPQYLLQKGD